jgi:hypothetical protein
VTFTTSAPLAPPSPAVLLAERRADRFLRGLLTARQRRMWERFRYIIVPSPNRPGVVYRIPAHGMIRQFERGRPVRDLCIHVNDDLPVGDRIVSFKLLIEAEEAELHRTANVHRIPSAVLAGRS